MEQTESFNAANGYAALCEPVALPAPLKKSKQLYQMQQLQDFIALFAHSKIGDLQSLMSSGMLSDGGSAPHSSSSVAVSADAVNLITMRWLLRSLMSAGPSAYRLAAWRVRQSISGEVVARKIKSNVCLM